VAHIGDVHHVGHFITPLPEGPHQGIVGDVGTEIPDVGVVVYRGAAAVKARLAALDWLKDLQCPSKGVIKGKRHGFSIGENEGERQGYHGNKKLYKAK
jgi:hypothetical protein